MKKIDKDVKLKHTVSKADYKQFFDAFTPKPSIPGLYKYEDRNVDYHFLKGEAVKRGIAKIPSEAELKEIVS